MKPRAKTAEELRIIKAFHVWQNAITSAYLMGDFIQHPRLKGNGSPALREIRQATAELLRANQDAGTKPRAKSKQRTRKTLRHADTRHG
jgi:hypothetical protein